MAFPPKKDGPDGGGGGGHSPVAAILLKLKHGDKPGAGGPPGPGGDPAGGGGDDLEFAMQDFITAVKSGDARAAADLFRSMSDLADAGGEPDEDDGQGEGGGVPPEGDAGGPPEFPGKEE